MPRSEQFQVMLRAINIIEKPLHAKISTKTFQTWTELWTVQLACVNPVNMNSWLQWIFRIFFGNSPLITIQRTDVFKIASLIYSTHKIQFKYRNFYSSSQTSRIKNLPKINGLNSNSLFKNYNIPFTDWYNVFHYIFFDQIRIDLMSASSAGSSGERAVTLDDVSNATDDFQSIDVLRVVAEQTPPVFQLLDKVVTWRRLKLARPNFRCKFIKRFGVYRKVLNIKHSLRVGKVREVHS